MYLEGKIEETIDTYNYHFITFLKGLNKRQSKLSELRSVSLLSFKEFLLKQNKSEKIVNYIILNEK